MPEDSRQQRRRQLRERLKTGQRALDKGLEPQPGRGEVVAVAEVFRAKLAEAGNHRRASEAAAMAHGLNERSLTAYPTRAAIACGKGCSYCCHTFVAVLPPEAFLLADAVRSGRAGAIDAATARTRARPLIGLTPAERIGRKLACPLLVEASCSVYPARPLVCRQATSLSLPACIEEYEGSEKDGRVEASSVHLAHTSNAYVLLLSAMLAVGLPGDAYELGSILEVVLDEPECERRWLGGDQTFAGLPQHFRRPPTIDRVAAIIARELRA